MEWVYKLFINKIRATFFLIKSLHHFLRPFVHTLQTLVVHQTIHSFENYIDGNMVFKDYFGIGQVPQPNCIQQLFVKHNGLPKFKQLYLKCHASFYHYSFHIYVLYMCHFIDLACDKSKYKSIQKMNRRFNEGILYDTSWRLHCF